MREAMASGRLGMIDTPRQGNRRPPGVTWMADNGCYGKGYPGDKKYLEWLRRHLSDADRCLLATAPDVVGDARATLERSGPMLPRIREIGYRAALVAQDGLEDMEVPWSSFDALFVGGTTEWKLGPGARLLILEAIDRGLWVHMGRVNSGKRFRYARDLGCGSADGTFLTFGPEKNLPRLYAWDKAS